jgi:hypothetical protein
MKKSGSSTTTASNSKFKSSVNSDLFKNKFEYYL